MPILNLDVFYFGEGKNPLFIYFRWILIFKWSHLLFHLVHNKESNMVTENIWKVEKNKWTKAGEMDQSRKQLLHKHENLSSDL